MAAEKAPIKKKVPKLKDIKKPLIIGGIIAVISITGIVSGIIIFSETPKGGRLIGGVIIEFEDIDPIVAGFEEELVPIQVTETLFESDYSSGISRIIHNLAIAHDWSLNATELTCYLREDVQFHDGTPFNATAVKWNFDRIYNLLSQPTNWGYLFILPDGRWIVNETQVINEYTVKFVLNEPFVPFQQLLTHYTTGILSPTSTPFNKTLNIHLEDLVGTGAFKYGSYEPSANITLYPYKNYWGQPPKIDELVISFYESKENESLWNDFLTNEIHFIHPIFFRRVRDKTIESLNNEPGITVQDQLSVLFRYIGMNNNLINLTMRKAMSYAVNYSYMVEDLKPPAVQGFPIPEGVLYSNTTAFEVPYYNIKKARQIIIDELGSVNSRVASLTPDDNITTGNEWERLVDEGIEIATYTLDYYPWNPTLTKIANYIPDNLKQIGIKVIPEAISWSDPFELWVFGWIYDYNDPHNTMLFFHSTGLNNYAQLNDSLVDQWIEDGLKETNPSLRKQIYFKIQERLIEELYPFIWLMSARESAPYASNLRGWPLNPLKIALKTVYFV